MYEITAMRVIVKKQFTRRYPAAKDSSLLMASEVGMRNLPDIIFKFLSG